MLSKRYLLRCVAAGLPFKDKDDMKIQEIILLITFLLSIAGAYQVGELIFKLWEILK